MLDRGFVTQLTKNTNEEKQKQNNSIADLDGTRQSIWFFHVDLKRWKDIVSRKCQKDSADCFAKVLICETRGRTIGVATVPDIWIVCVHTPNTERDNGNARQCARSQCHQLRPPPIPWIWPYHQWDDQHSAEDQYPPRLRDCRAQGLEIRTDNYETKTEKEK